MWSLIKAALSSGMPAPIENEIADATDACLQPAVASLPAENVASTKRHIHDNASTRPGPPRSVFSALRNPSWRQCKHGVFMAFTRGSSQASAPAGVSPGRRDRCPARPAHAP